MATLKAYPLGGSMGRGNNDPVGGKRGIVNGWTRASVRRHLAKLYSVDVAGLDGDGFGVTLTVRDTPASHDDWRALVKRLDRAMREAGLSRWHWVVEWQRRGTPHLHLAVYAPPGWESPISDTRSGNAGRWVVAVWLRLAAEYGAGSAGQAVVRITGPAGWLAYLSKHASRGVAHYQRHGSPPGWTSTGRLWGFGGRWPFVEPIVADITDVQMRKVRRLVRSYVVADARATFLAESRRHACSGCARARRPRKKWCRTCLALRRWQWSRRMLRHPDRHVSAVRGMSEWVPGSVLLQFAYLAGWSGELKGESVAV